MYAFQAQEKQQMLEDLKNEYEVRLSFHTGENKQLMSTISTLQVLYVLQITNKYV